MNYKIIPELILYYPLSDTVIRLQINNSSTGFGGFTNNIQENSDKIIKMLVNNKIDYNYELDEIHFSSGEYRGWTFGDIYEKLWKEPEILNDIYYKKTLYYNRKIDILYKEYSSFIKYMYMKYIRMIYYNMEEKLISKIIDFL